MIRTNDEIPLGYAPEMTRPSATPHASARIEHALFRAAELAPSRAAIVERERQLTYGELAARAAGLATQLVAGGLAPGERVAIFLDKSLECVVAIYGTWAAGGVIVPIHEGLKRAQIDHILEDSGGAMLVSDARRVQRVEGGGLGRPFVEVGAETAAWSSLPVRETPPSELAALLYTSGSTGRPKGIAISHANLVAGARIVSTYLGITEDERILSVLPFSFDYGLNQLLTVIAQRATLFLQRSHLPADICRSLQTFEITGLAGVPPLWAQLLQRTSPFATLSFPRLRYLTNSGGVFPKPLLARYRELLPTTDVVLMYGLTEAFRSTYLPPGELDRRPDSMGKAIPETEILVVDDAGKPCAPGEIGELVHAGPTVALGYWNNAEATNEKWRPHPLDPSRDERVVYSGDLVRTDEEGFLYFVSRRDQMLKCYGFRVSPEDVEEQLHASKLVLEAVIVGQPHEIAGTALVAHVVPREPASFDPAVLLDYCRAQMPQYMVPVEIVTRESLPRTSSGKLDRKRVASGV
jgi:acyl-CoA ligase (AMP-forming) (exosortase A-associated)